MRPTNDPPKNEAVLFVHAIKTFSCPSRQIASENVKGVFLI